MSIFDAIIIIIIMILGIKGFFNGFVRELAGLIGLIGGLYLASIYYHQVGVYINNNLINIKNSSAIDLVGFVAVFFIFWIISIFIGFLLAQILKLSSLGILDRLVGVVFSAGKFFVIFSIVLALIYQIKFLRKEFNLLFQNSKLIPIMLYVGEKVINIDNKI